MSTAGRPLSGLGCARASAAVAAALSGWTCCVLLDFGSRSPVHGRMHQQGMWADLAILLLRTNLTSFCCALLQQIAESKAEGTPADRFLDLSGNDQEANQVC